MPQFRPHLLAIVEFSRPTSICLYGITGGPNRYTVWLPGDIASWSEEERLQLLKEAAVENYQKNQGITLFQGPILGYMAYLQEGTEPLRLTADGDPDRSNEPYHVAGPVTVTVGGKELKGQFG